MRDLTAQAITRYLTESKRRYSPNTIRNWRPLLTRIAAAHGGLYDLTSLDIDRWLDLAGVGARTRRTYVSTLASFYRWSICHGYCTDNPAADATRLKTPRALPRPARGDDLSRALAAADDRMRAWLCLMGYAGLRCCEVAGLCAEDLLWHLEPPMIHVCHGAKGGHERLVPLSAGVEDALLAHGIPLHGPVFRRAAGGPVAPWYVSRHVNGHLHDLGIRATAHQLRHTFATAVYGETHDIRATQDFMGHLSPQTTAVYAAFAASDAAAVVRGFGRA